MIVAVLSGNAMHTDGDSGVSLSSGFYKTGYLYELKDGHPDLISLMHYGHARQATEAEIEQFRGGIEKASGADPTNEHSDDPGDDDTGAQDDEDTGESDTDGDDDDSDNEDDSKDGDDDKKEDDDGEDEDKPRRRRRSRRTTTDEDD